MRRTIIALACLGSWPALAQQNPASGTGGAPAGPPPAYGMSINLEQATRAADAAEAEAKRNNWPVVIAVVDTGGHLVHLRRLDNTQTASVRIAEGKASTAVAFRRPTKVLEEGLQTSPRLLAVRDMLPIEGGFPILMDGKVVGGIGVSGVTAQQDGQAAKAGADALK